MGYLRVFLEPLWEASERILAVDGNMKLFEGINLIKVGGHTPGSQVVEVDTAEGKVVIAGDLIMSFENLQREWPIGLFWSLEECMRGIRYLREQDVPVLPGHDWKVRDIDSIG
jgi:glyoxylase-like metal-dependent hydrolase (beta-lactamase superfamily II)